MPPTEVLEPAPLAPAAPATDPKPDAAPPPAKADADDGASLVGRLYAKRAGEKPAAVVAAEPEAPKKEEKVKPAPKAKVPKEPAAPLPPPDYEAMGERIAAGITKGIAPLVAQPAAKPDRTAPLRFTERENYQIIKRLEEQQPEIYKGRAEKYLDQLERQEKREAQWLADNPDGEYDPDSVENSAFTKQNSLDDIDGDDFEAARKAVWMAEATSEVEKRFAPKIAPLEARSRLDAERPRIFGARVQAARSFLGMVGDEFSKTLGSDGRIILEEGNKLVAANPVNLIPLNIAGKVEAFADQIFRLARPNPLPPMDKPDNPNAPYVSPDDVLATAVKYENDLKSLPANLPLSQGGSMDAEGRQFATSEEFQAMTEAQRRRHWRLDGDKIVLMYSADQADFAKQAMQQREIELESFAKARGYVKNGSPAVPEEAPKQAPSPPGTIAPNAAPEMARTLPKNESPNSGWLSSLYGRK
jgi:hypothetical protein